VEDDGQPLFVQVAEQIEAAILDGSLPEEARAPSTNELAAFHRINPATAAKGLGRLAADGVLYKKRGIGMFVTTGARESLLKRRREEFTLAYLEPMLAEARKLGLDRLELQAMMSDSLAGGEAGEAAGGEGRR
jgi:DNA-binding transcriptional regulator YhcF (GntR family)